MYVFHTLNPVNQGQSYIKDSNIFELSTFKLLMLIFKDYINQILGLYQTTQPSFPSGVENIVALVRNHIVCHWSQG
jgi:hypothetical protein